MCADRMFTKAWCFTVREMGRIPNSSKQLATQHWYISITSSFFANCIKRYKLRFSSIRFARSNYLMYKYDWFQAHDSFQEDIAYYNYSLCFVVTYPDTLDSCFSLNERARARARVCSFVIYASTNKSSITVLPVLSRLIHVHLRHMYT